MLYIVSYDIESDKNRKKVAEVLLEYGVRVQYSVFECLLKKNELPELYDKIKPLISEKTDSVIFCPVCLNCSSKKEVIGITYDLKTVGLITDD